MVGLNISRKVTLMPLAMAAIFLAIPINEVQYIKPACRLRSPLRRSLPSRHLRFEAPAQPLEVMLRVSGNDIGQRPDGYGMLVGDAGARLDLRVEGSEQRDRRLANALELRQQIRER